MTLPPSKREQRFQTEVEMSLALTVNPAGLVGGRGRRGVQAEEQHNTSTESKTRWAWGLWVAMAGQWVSPKER